MGEVHVSLVKYDDFTGLDAGAQFPGALGVVVPGGVHEGKARQKTLQVQPQMTLGRRLAPPVFGPIHTRGDQGNGGRIHQMNRAPELAGETFAGFATDKAWGALAQVIQDRPKELFGHLGRADLVGMRERVAIGRGGAADTRKRPRVQTQRVAHVIETDAVRELGVHQGQHVTPRLKGAGLLRRAGLARQFGHQKLRNKIANLPQQIQFRDRWNGCCFLFHPCRVAGLNQSFQHFLKNPV